MVYERNLNALRAVNNSGRIVRYLEEHTEWKSKKVSVEDALNNEQIIVYHDMKDIYLNSRYNPSAAADVFIDQFTHITEQSGLIMFGLSNGVFAKKFFEKIDKEVFLFVYEPSIDIFQAVIHEIDISDLLLNRKFLIFVEGINEGSLATAIESNSGYQNYCKILYTELPQYVRLFEKSYDIYREIVKKQAVALQLTINTALVRGNRFSYTAIQNMRYLPGCRNGFDYVGKFPADMPAIVVAAGPSLEKNVDLLKQAKGKALIIVVDSAIKTVYSRGIQPDFVITIDALKPTHLFEVKGIEQAYLLADGGANTDVLDMIHPQNLVFYSSSSPIWDRLFREEGTQIEEVYCGGSVAIDALTMAIIMGFKRVILIGQDLALTGDKQYADGEKLDKSPRPGEVVVKDIYGNDIRTLQDYREFIRAIERLAYEHPQLEIIDATEGGAFKKNTTIMTFQEAIDKYCLKEYPIREIIEKVPKLFTKSGPIRIKKTLESMKKNVKDIGERTRIASEYCDKAYHMLEAKQYNKLELQKINAYIAEVDELYVHMPEESLFSCATSFSDFNFMRRLYEEEEDDVTEAIRLYKNSVPYYQGIAEAAPQIAGTIDDCLKKLKQQYNLSDD